jgi:co-chaperonin GroES (HSP10)
MKIIPFPNRTVIEPIKNVETKTLGGIILAETVQHEYSDMGYIIESDSYAKNSLVILPPYKYSTVKIDDSIYFVVFSKDILGEIMRTTGGNG